MRRLVIKLIGKADYVGTKRYTVFEDGKSIADIYSHKDLPEIANEYWKELKETDIVIEYDTKYSIFEEDD